MPRLILWAASESIQPVGYKHIIVAYPRPLVCIQPSISKYHKWCGTDYTDVWCVICVVTNSILWSDHIALQIKHFQSIHASYTDDILGMKEYVPLRP